VKLSIESPPRRPRGTSPSRRPELDHIRCQETSKPLPRIGSRQPTASSARRPLLARLRNEPTDPAESGFAS
jgi:hypothetical protein